MITENKIKKYIEKGNIYKKALLLDDNWGSGKSQMIKNVLSGNIENLTIDKVKSYAILNANEIDESTSLRQILVTSSNKINTNEFYGLGKKDANLIAGFFSANKKLMGAIVEKTTKAVDGYIENKTGVKNLIESGLEVIGIGGETALKQLDFTGYVLVIDEIDRINGNSNLKSIYAKIIELQENTNVRLIIVMNSKKLDDIDKNVHDEWKDKIYSAIIKMDNSTYFDTIKPIFWKTVEPAIKKITGNYKNIRIMQKYNEIDETINDIINSKMNNAFLNEYQTDEIENEKKYLIQRLYAYYNPSEYKESMGSSFNKVKHDEKMEIIEKLLNLDDSMLDEKINYILISYNDDYARLKNSIKHFYGEFVHNHQVVEKRHKKDKAFKFVKDKLINENLEKINLTCIEKSDMGKEDSLIYYLKYLKDSFKITMVEEKQIIELIIKKLMNESKKNKAYIDFTNTQLIDELRRQKVIYHNIYNEKCLTEKDKFKILYFVKKSIKNLVKRILNSYNDNMSLEIKHFHFKHNHNIIDDIYKNLENRDNLLFRLRDLKEFVGKKDYDTIVSKYYANLKRPKITKDEMIKV